MMKIPGLPYFLPGTEQGYQECRKRGVAIMMDSGVFSYRTHKAYLIRTGKPIDQLPTDEDYVKLYVKWCRQFHEQWAFYVTIDFAADCKANYERQLMLEKKGIRPLPVYHGDDSLDYIKKYADLGYTYMCVGATSSMRRTVTARRRYLDAVFSIGAKIGMQFHGLAVTAPWAVIEFPWKSVDSSAWSRAAGYGCLLHFNPETGRMATIRISTRGAKSGPVVLPTKGRYAEKLTEWLAAEGYDIKELQTDHIARHEYNAFTMQKLGQASGSKQTYWGSLV